MLTTTMLGNMDGVCNSMPGWNPLDIWSVTPSSDSIFSHRSYFLFVRSCNATPSESKCRLEALTSGPTARAVFACAPPSPLLGILIPRACPVRNPKDYRMDPDCRNHPMYGQRGMGAGASYGGQY